MNKAQQLIKLVHEGNEEIRYKNVTIYAHKYSDGDWEAYIHDDYVPQGYKGKVQFLDKDKNKVIQQAKAEVDKILKSQK